MVPKGDGVYVQRRWVAVAVAATVLLVPAYLVTKAGEGDPTATAPASTATSTTSAVRVGPSSGPSSVTPATGSVLASSTTAVPTRSAPSAQTRLVRLMRLTGNLSAKSVDASHGLVFAQNMMYQHSISVFAADGRLLRTIPDTVDLAALGIPGHPGLSRGAPVEMAYSPDGRTAWVSNYSMYGAGFLPEGRDACTGPAGTSRSFLYRIDTSTYAITAAVEVGYVPKYVAVTPDGRSVLVTNWCSMDLDVVDAASNRVSATIPVTGPHPRGIAVTADSRTAYVAVMGAGKVVRVDLRTRKVTDFARTGDGPRHVVLSPDGHTLYVTNNGSGTVSAVDAATGRVLRDAVMGRQPRSMAISPDGTALYVVNYSSSSVSKVRTSDLTVTQTVPVDGLPIGITYEQTRRAVWVSCYSGVIDVFDDSRLAAS